MSDAAARAAALLGGRLGRVQRLSGGDLSAVFRIDLADGGSAVVKQADSAPAEADMLRAIAATGAPAPKVLAVADDLLVMEALPANGSLSGAGWDDLAAALGRLHGATCELYGWHRDHAFGPVAIPNGWRGDWPGFWAHNRLCCHVPHIPADLGHRVKALSGRLGEMLPERPAPALLHGDLWGGNMLASGGRLTGLIDPACYHGHREVDVAMLTLFDRPPDSFFDALALEPGWRERLPVYRLWPLLVHLRLFGAGYAGAVSAALEASGF